MGEEPSGISMEGTRGITERNRAAFGGQEPNSMSCLGNIYSSIMRMVEVVGGMRACAEAGTGASADGLGRLAHESDLLAFTIAVETVLFFDQGKEGAEVSDDVTRCAAAILIAGALLSRLIKEAAGEIEKDGQRSDELLGTLRNAGHIIQQLRRTLLRLCFPRAAAECRTERPMWCVRQGALATR